MRKERINGVRCEVLNHCLVYFWNFAIIDITTEQNISNITNDGEHDNHPDECGWTKKK